jgi:SAM-dependent methyltransferase
VMEHVPEPKLVLKELYRVLKPGGKMIYSAPLCFEEHEQPYDFYRYTQFSLRYLFDAAGFSIQRLDWLEGYFGTVGYHLNCSARYLPYKPRDLGGGLLAFGLVIPMLLLKSVFAACSLLFHLLEVFIKFKKSGYPKNYLAIVYKPLPTS